LGFGFVPMTTQCHQFWCNYLVKKGKKKRKRSCLFGQHCTYDHIKKLFIKISYSNYLLKWCGWEHLGAFWGNFNFFKKKAHVQ
jgi:hypothetical protein